MDVSLLLSALQGQGQAGGQGQPSLLPQGQPSLLAQGQPSLLSQGQGGQGQGGRVPQAGSDLDWMRGFGWGTAPPVGTGASSPTLGAQVASGPGVQPTAKSNQTSGSSATSAPNLNASDTVPKPLQDLQALIQARIANDDKRFQDLLDRGQANWQAVNSLQQQMANSPTPQLKPVAMNPMAILATALGAGAFNSRYNNGAQDFTSDLLGGLARNNQTQFENEQLAHQNKMAVLSSAVQAARDQGQTDRYLGQTLLRGNEAADANMNTVLQRLFSGQGHDQATIQKGQLTADMRAKIAQGAKENGALRSMVLDLNNAGPEMRGPIYDRLRIAFPDYYGGMTDAAIDSASLLKPEEVLSLQKAAQDEADAKAKNTRVSAISGLNPAQKASYFAQAKKADADVQAALIGANKDGSFGDAEMAGIKAHVGRFEPELRARVAQNLVDSHTLDLKSANQRDDPGIIRQQLQNAQRRVSLNRAQMDALVRANGGDIPDPNSSDGQFYASLLADNHGVERAAQKLGRGMPQVGTDGQDANNALVPNATAVPAKGKGVQPVGVDVGPIAGAPIEYGGGMKTNEMIKGLHGEVLPLDKWLKAAQRIIQANKGQSPEAQMAARQELIERYGHMGITIR